MSGGQPRSSLLGSLLLGGVGEINRPHRRSVEEICVAEQRPSGAGKSAYQYRLEVKILRASTGFWEVSNKNGLSQKYCFMQLPGKRTLLTIKSRHLAFTSEKNIVNFNNMNSASLILFLQLYQLVLYFLLSHFS